MLIPLLTSSFLFGFVACQSMTPTSTDADAVFPFLTTNHNEDLQASFSAELSSAYHASSDHSISSGQLITNSSRILELPAYASSVDSLIPFSTALTSSPSKELNIENLHTSMIAKTKSKLESYSSQIFIPTTTEQTNKNENIFDMLKRSWIDVVEDKIIGFGVIAENISNSEYDVIKVATSSVQILHSLEPLSGLFANYIVTNSATIMQSSVPQRHDNTMASKSSSSLLLSNDDFIFEDFNIIGDSTTEELVLHANTIYESDIHITPTAVENSHSQNNHNHQLAISDEKFGTVDESDSFVNSYGTALVSNTGSSIYQAQEESTGHSFQERNPNIYSTVIFNNDSNEADIQSTSRDVVASSYEKLTPINIDIITEAPGTSLRSEMTHSNFESSAIYGGMPFIFPSSTEVTKRILSTDPSVAPDFWFAGIMPSSEETFEQSENQKWSLNLPYSRDFYFLNENVPSADVEMSSFVYQDMLSDFIATYPRDQQVLFGDKDVLSSDYSIFHPLYQDLPSHDSVTSSVLNHDMPFHGVLSSSEYKFDKDPSSNEYKFHPIPSSSKYEFQIYSSLSDFENNPFSSDYEFYQFSNDYVFNPYPSDYKFFLFSNDYEFNPSLSDYDFNPSFITIEKYPSSSERNVDVLSTRQSQDLPIVSHISVTMVSIQGFDLSSHTIADLGIVIHTEVRHTPVPESYDSSEGLPMNLSVLESVGESTIMVNPILREFGSSVHRSDEMGPVSLSTDFKDWPLNVHISPVQTVGTKKSGTYQDYSLSNSSNAMISVLRSSMKDSYNNSVSIKTVNPILREFGSSFHNSDEMTPEIFSTDFQEWPRSVQVSPAKTIATTKSEAYQDDSLDNSRIAMFTSDLRSSMEDSYNMPNTVSIKTVLMSSVYARTISLITVPLSDVVSSGGQDITSEAIPELLSTSGSEQLYRTIDNVQPTSVSASIKSFADVSSIDSVELDSLYSVSADFQEWPRSVQVSPAKTIDTTKSEAYQDDSLHNSRIAMFTSDLRSSMEDSYNMPYSVGIKTVLMSSVYARTISLITFPLSDVVSSGGQDMSSEAIPDLLSSSGSEQLYRTIDNVQPTSVSASIKSFADVSSIDSVELDSLYSVSAHFQEWPRSVQVSPAKTIDTTKSEAYQDDSLDNSRITMFTSDLRSFMEDSYNMPNTVSIKTVLMSSVYARTISLITGPLSDVVSSGGQDITSEAIPELLLTSGSEQVYRTIDNVQPTSVSASIHAIKSIADVSSIDIAESDSLYSVSAANYLSSESDFLSSTLMSSFDFASVLETPSLYTSTKLSSLPRQIAFSEWVYYESLTDQFASLQGYETEFTELRNTDFDSSSILHNDNLISPFFISSTLDELWNSDMGYVTDYSYIMMPEHIFFTPDWFTASSGFSTLHTQNVVPTSEYDIMSSSRSVISSHLTNIHVAVSLSNVTLVPGRNHRSRMTDLPSWLISDETNNEFRTLDTTKFSTFLPALTTILSIYMGSTSELNSNIVATRSWSKQLETANIVANDVSVDERSLELLPESLFTSLFLPASESLPVSLMLDLTIAGSIENDVSTSIVGMSHSISQPPDLLFISLYEPPFLSASDSLAAEIISTSVDMQQSTEPNSVDILPSSTLNVDSTYSMSFGEESISGLQSLTGSDVILPEVSQIDSSMSRDSMTSAIDTVALSFNPVSTEMASSFDETVIAFETDLLPTSFLDNSFSSELVISTTGETLNASLVIDNVSSTKIMTSVDMVNVSLISDEIVPTQNMTASESFSVEAVSTSQNMISVSNNVINASLVSEDIPSTPVVIQATNVSTASDEQTMSTSAYENATYIPMPSNSSDIIEITIEPSSSVLIDSVITDTRVVETFVTLVCFETMVMLNSPLPDEIQMSMFINASVTAEKIQSFLTKNVSAVPEEFASTTFVDVVSLSDVIQSSLFDNASVLPGKIQSSTLINATEISEDIPSSTFLNVSLLFLPSIIDNASVLPEEIQSSIIIEASVISEEILSSMFVDLSWFSEDIESSVFDDLTALPEEIQSSNIINATVISEGISSSLFVHVSLISEDLQPSIFDNSSSLPEEIQSSMNINASVTSEEIQASIVNTSMIFATPLLTTICMNVTYLSNDSEFETTNVSAVETILEVQTITFVQNTNVSSDEVTPSLISVPSIVVLITELPSSDLLTTIEATSTQIAEGTSLPAMSSEDLMTPTAAVDSVSTPPLTIDLMTTIFPVDIVTSVPTTEDIVSLTSTLETLSLGTSTFKAISQSPTAEDITTDPATDLSTIPVSTTAGLITASPTVEETIASTMEDIFTQAPGTEIVTTQVITSENIISTPIIVDTITEFPALIETIMASPASTVEETVILSSMVEDILTPSPTVEDVIQPSSTTENVLTTNPTAEETNSTSTIVSETIISSPIDVKTSIPSTTIELISTSSTVAVESSSILVPEVSTPMPLLNMSNAFVGFYIVTVIKVPPTDDITTVLFLTTMEGRLAAAYVEAFNRGEQILNGTYKPLKRRKRYVQVEDIALQMINVTRTANSNNVSLLYYMEKNGTAVPAKNAVQHLNLFTDQELALRLGYVVQTRATAYVPEPVPPDSKLWIIGAVIGGILGLLLILWCILCVYFKCCRRRESKTPRGVSEPHLVRVKTPEGMAYSGPRPVLEHQDVAIERANGNANMGSPKRQLYQVNHPEDHAHPVYARVQKSPRHSPKHDHRSPGDVSTDGENTVVYISEQGEVKAHKKRPRKQRKSKPHTDVEVDNVEERMQMSAQSVSSAQPVRVPTPRHQAPRPNTYEADSELQQRSEIERWRNKQRLREKRKGTKKDKLEPLDQSSEEYKAYLKSQDEDGSLLSDPGNTEKAIPDVFLQPPTRSPKKHRKSRKKHDTGGHVYENESFLDSETPASTADQDTVSAARFRMHQLLDDAFTLLTPNQSDSSGNKVQPELLSPSSDSSSRPVPTPRQNIKSRGKHRKHDRNSPESSDRDSARAYGEQDTLPIQEKKHTPIYLKGLSSVSHTGLPGDDPYKAADESSLISLPQKQTNGHDGSISPYHDKLFTTTFTQKLPNSIQSTKEASRSMVEKMNGSIHTKYISSKSEKMNGHMSHNKTNGDVKYYDLESALGPTKIASSGYNKKGSVDLVEMNVMRRGQADRDDIDIIKDSIEPGSSPTPLIQSIRSELLRLSNKMPENEKNMFLYGQR